jgi:dihydrofolate reductase
MALLLYMNIASLDGYVEDRSGGFGWAEPDEEVHGFVNDVFRDVGTELYGRRLYETMAVWETDPSLTEGSAITQDFAQVWQAADKVVYSTTMPESAIVTARTSLERTFDADAVVARKAKATKHLTVGGPGLAAEAFRAGIVDEIHLFVVPVIVGGGKPALPEDLRLDLELLDERRFASSGVVYLRYAVRSPA